MWCVDYKLVFCNCESVFEKKSIKMESEIENEDDLLNLDEVQDWNL